MLNVAQWPPEMNIFAPANCESTLLLLLLTWWNITWFYTGVNNSPSYVNKQERQHNLHLILLLLPRIFVYQIRQQGKQYHQQLENSLSKHGELQFENHIIQVASRPNSNWETTFILWFYRSVLFSKVKNS